MPLSYTYSVILEPAEEGGFLVHVPALPEICTEGDTEEEALAMARDAIELVIDRNAAKPFRQKFNSRLSGSFSRGMSCHRSLAVSYVEAMCAHLLWPARHEPICRAAFGHCAMQAGRSFEF